MSSEEIPQAFGVLNLEIMELRRENEALKQYQKQENEQNLEDSFLEISQKAKRLMYENKKLKDKLNNAVSNNQVNSLLKELQETQEKLKKSEIKTSEQFRVIMQLKELLTEQENIKKDNENIEVLKNNLENSQKENKMLKMEIEELRNKEKDFTSTLGGLNIPQVIEKIKNLEEKLKNSEKMQIVVNENLKTESELRKLAEKRSNYLYETLKQNKCMYEENYSENETCVKILMSLMKCSAIDVVSAVQDIIMRNEELKKRVEEKEDKIRLIESLEREIDNIRKTTVDKKLFDAEQVRFDKLNDILIETKRREEELREKLQNLEESKSGIPEPSLQPKRIFSPRKHKMIYDNEPPSARIPF